MKIIRYKYNTYNVIDRVYNDNSLQFEQSNLNSKNRFGAVSEVGIFEMVEYKRIRQ